jgi:amidase
VQVITATDLKNCYSPRHEMHASVRPGERFQVETEDCFGGRYRTPEDFTAENMAWTSENLNVVTGPIHVEGANPGNVVAVEIEAIELRETAAAIVSRYQARSPDDWWHEEYRCMPVPIEDGEVVYGKVRIPVRPVIGCVATAPAQETVLSRHEDDFGGNQDCAAMTTGATIVMRNFIEGGGLYFGDVKACMADGEIAQGPEVGALLTMRVSLRERPAAMTWPRVETQGEWTTVVSDINLADACRGAFRELMLWIEAETQAEREHIALVMGTTAHARVCQVSNRMHTASCSAPRWLVDQLR